MENFLLQFYGGRADDDGATAVPREILVPVLPSQEAATEAELTQWLSDLRGSRVSLRVPQRGDKRALAETVTRNAAEALTQHRLKRASDLTARSAALTELADALSMDVAPLRIECIDVSHVQGTNVVASLVVFEDGLPKRSDYRRFAIREHPGDDVASIAEVVRRRFTHGNARPGDRGRDADRRRIRPARPRVPVDAEPTYRPRHRPGDRPPPAVRLPAAAAGGRRRSAAGQRRRRRTGRTGDRRRDDLRLAKRLEEVWVPGQDEPIIFPRTSEALYLLQRLRDEAHRFAITYHRAKRSKSMTVSALDNVAGLGDVRRKALIRHFGSVAALRKADVEEVLAVPGLGRRTAEAVVAALAGAPAAPQRTAPAPTPGRQPPAGRTLPSRTATEANPIPSTGTQETATRAATRAAVFRSARSAEHDAHDERADQIRGERAERQQPAGSDSARG